MGGAINLSPPEGGERLSEEKKGFLRFGKIPILREKNRTKERRKPVVANIGYYEMICQMKNAYSFRKKLVEYALENGISAAAREFHTTRKTVYKWLHRYQEEGVSGLVDRSRAPHHCPHKLSVEIEQKIVAIRKLRPYLGPYRIREEYGIQASIMAIYRVLKDYGLIRPRKRKYKTKRDLRAVKQKLRPFELIQVDIKELKDIPNYYPYLVIGFPPYQFSARDVRTGISFVSYGYEKSSTNTGIFLLYVGMHLWRCGVDLREVTWQTDNGSEFIGSPTRKQGKTLFEEIAAWFGSKTATIPPRQSTFNSDVEAMHRLIEEEFYDLESYQQRKQFLQKAMTYMVYFNAFRKFRYKYGQTPLDILKKAAERSVQIKKIPVLTPIILDDFVPMITNFKPDQPLYLPNNNLTSEKIKQPPEKLTQYQDGYHVPISDTCLGALLDK